MEYSIYDSDGAVLLIVSASGTCPIEEIADGRSYIEGKVNQDTHYLPAGILTERPEFQIICDKINLAAGGVEVATLTGVPVGAKVSTHSVSGIGDGTPLELTYEEVGTYVVTVSMFPYLDWRITINAT